VICFL